jgi:hypothetical protein
LLFCSWRKGAQQDFGYGPKQFRSTKAARAQFSAPNIATINDVEIEWMTKNMGLSELEDCVFCEKDPAKCIHLILKKIDKWRSFVGGAGGRKGVQIESD